MIPRGRDELKDQPAQKEQIKESTNAVLPMTDKLLSGDKPVQPEQSLVETGMVSETSPNESGNIVNKSQVESKTSVLLQNLNDLIKKKQKEMDPL